MTAAALLAVYQTVAEYRIGFSVVGSSTHLTLETELLCGFGSGPEEHIRLGDYPHARLSHIHIRVVADTLVYEPFLPSLLLLLIAIVTVSLLGVETIHGLGSMSDYEKEVYSSMSPELLASIEKGVKFVKEN